MRGCVGKVGDQRQILKKEPWLTAGEYTGERSGVPMQRPGKELPLIIVGRTLKELADQLLKGSDFDVNRRPKR